MSVVDHHNERSCTAHIHDDPIEAELTTEDNGCTYLVMRCTTCNRPQGLRLVRKSDPRHPNHIPTTNPKDQP